MRRTDYLTEKRPFHQLPASLVMEQEVKFCRATDTGRNVALQLTQYNIGSLPVVDDKGALVGLVTEFDLLNVLLKGKELKDVRAEQIMTRDVKYVREDTLVDEIIHLLENDHLIRVPVVKNGKLTGIVARRDILFGYIRSTAEYWP